MVFLPLFRMVADWTKDSTPSTAPIETSYSFTKIKLTFPKNLQEKLEIKAMV